MRRVVDKIHRHEHYLSGAYSKLRQAYMNGFEAV